LIDINEPCDKELVTVQLRCPANHRQQLL